MTTTDFSVPPPPPPAPPTRVIRRSASDRVAAGVCGGLGEYFGLDPVLFRVLFAVSAFFGGAGIVAYLLAWAVIPDATTTDAPLDRFVREMRKRKVPIWLVAIVAALVAWGALFSWWAPGPFFLAVVAVVVLVIVLSRRVAPAKSAATDPAMAVAEPGAAEAAPKGWVPETQAWIAESRARSRERRRRAAPVRWAILGALVATMGVLAIADAVSGIVIPAYFWTAGGIVVLGLVVGLVLRRTPWTLTVLLIPVIIGLIGFAGSRASLHDGIGQKFWTPTSAGQLDSSYRLGVGQGVLNLSDVDLDQPRTVDVTMGAGQLRVLVPSGLNVQVDAHVHAGTVELNGSDDFLPGGHTSGVNLDLVVPGNGFGPKLTIDVHLTDGNVSVESLGH
jgi:phage shock protein PspC (stress-responsive transcriptional regulator)